jgi:hypothetical protein
MADVEPVKPGLPLGRSASEPRRDAPPNPQRRRQPRRDELTDDQGEHHDEPPLIDDFA